MQELNKLVSDEIKQFYVSDIIARLAELNEIKTDMIDLITQENAIFKEDFKKQTEKPKTQAPVQVLESPVARFMPMPTMAEITTPAAEPKEENGIEIKEKKNNKIGKRKITQISDSEMKRAWEMHTAGNTDIEIANKLDLLSLWVARKAWERGKKLATLTTKIRKGSSKSIKKNKIK